MFIIQLQPQNPNFQYFQFFIEVSKASHFIRFTLGAEPSFRANLLLGEPPIRGLLYLRSLNNT